MSARTSSAPPVERVANATGWHVPMMREPWIKVAGIAHILQWTPLGNS